MREIRTLRAMWRALETGFSLKIYAPALDPTNQTLFAHYRIWKRSFMSSNIILMCIELTPV